MGTDDPDVEGLRRQLQLHAHDPSRERCPTCGRAYCVPYATATALLADAGEDPAAVTRRAA
ncbi:hypothetical protein [Catellatospora sp. NPDC049609]|uniref:hypothetical protein n=1 Tax=Catellatospora sp. NPDC049609 TaxID=3155505 RepID=UPI003440A19E